MGTHSSAMPAGQAKHIQGRKEEGQVSWEQAAHQPAYTTSFSSGSSTTGEEAQSLFSPWRPRFCPSCFQQVLPSAPSCTAPLATSCRAMGKARHSASWTLADSVSSVSSALTDTGSWWITALGQDSSYKRDWGLLGEAGVHEGTDM